MAYSQDFRNKMAAKGLKPAFVAGWIGLYEKYCAGEKGFMPESDLTPVTELPELASLPAGNEALLGKTVVFKLNGGLGTGMGLDKAKSLLEVKDGDTFLDIIAKQVTKLRAKFPVKFMLMNSFSTEEDTRNFMKKYPVIGDSWDEVNVVQNMAPKIEKATNKPGDWPSKPAAEWCPPGHGDLYAALVVTGQLDKLLAAGYEYIFVSNSDNLGATMDLRLLGYLASTGAPMVMEVCVRGEDDKKGGHLARDKAGNLTLRESAQCPPEDEGAFQDIKRHKFFNTNNLWLNLKKLKEAMGASGVLPLPLIVNEKKMDPSSKENPGPKVIQLETAMGAAISSLPGSMAIVVPFDRFAPVKTCNQLFGLRSDAYVISPDFTPVLAPGACKPIISFDDNYKMVPDMEKAIPNGVPSLKECQKLTVKGPVVFAAGTVIKGEITILNGGKRREVVSGMLKGSPDKLRLLKDVKPPGVYKVVFLRHGESVWNVANIFTGWHDVELSENGKQEAVEAGKCLKAKGYKFDMCFTSVLRRSIETCWTVCEHSENFSMPIIQSWRLNERHYGALQGLNKADTAAKYGDAQVKIWRRSFDIPPPSIELSDPRHPANDPLYAGVPKSALPGAESSELTIKRVTPFWDDHIAPCVMTGKMVLVAAHGNSLRGICKVLEGMDEKEFLDFNIPTAVPLVYELDAEMRFVRKYYLMDPDEVAAKIAAVAAQGSAKK